MSAQASRHDPLLVWNEGKQRYYQRKFDHDEARTLYAAGVSIGRIAVRYGVKDNAVRRIVVPGEIARQNTVKARWRSGTCEECGGPAMRLVAGKREKTPDGRTLCRRCRSDEKRERLLFSATGVLIAIRCSMLDCANGERWQPPENFPGGARHREIRAGGIHSQCRACNTRARQQYRDARKVPCVGCGALCLPPSEKTTNGHDEPRCRDCFVASRRKPSAVTLEAMPTRKGTGSFGA